MHNTDKNLILTRIYGRNRNIASRSYACHADILRDRRCNSALKLSITLSKDPQDPKNRALSELQSQSHVLETAETESWIAWPIVTVLTELSRLVLKIMTYNNFLFHKI